MCLMLQSIPGHRARDGVGMAGCPILGAVASAWSPLLIVLGHPWRCGLDVWSCFHLVEPCSTLWPVFPRPLPWPALGDDSKCRGYSVWDLISPVLSDSPYAQWQRQMLEWWEQVAQCAPSPGAVWVKVCLASHPQRGYRAREVREQGIWAEARARARRRNRPRLGVGRSGEIARDQGSDEAEKLPEPRARARWRIRPRLEPRLGRVEAEFLLLWGCPGPKGYSCGPSWWRFLECLGLRKAALGFFIFLVGVP